MKLFGPVFMSSIIITFSLPVAAQTPPPVNGTVALEGTMNTFYRGVNAVVVTTKDGIEHVYHFAKDLVVHGGHGNGPAALEGLREGTTVVVHYTGANTDQTAQEVDIVGDGGLQVAEGTVTNIDRQRGEITVRYDSGKIEKFKLTERAAGEAPKADDTGARVVIYYKDEAGNKVAHYFKPKS